MKFKGFFYPQFDYTLRITNKHRSLDEELKPAFQSFLLPSTKFSLRFPNATTIIHSLISALKNPPMFACKIRE